MEDLKLIEFASFLISAGENKVIYLVLEPEIVDFSVKNFTFTLKISYPRNSFTIDVNRTNFQQVYCLMKESIFKNKIKIISYNFKNFCSVYSSLAKKEIEIESDIFDLKIISNILGNRLEDAPTDFTGAYKSFKSILEGNWDKIKTLYKNIYLPLIFKVIPGIENSGIIDINKKTVLKSYYEIEAQENSRLSTFNCLSNCFLPMNLKKEEKNNYIPLNQEDFFVYFDYKNMEVSILENLTKDPSLSSILKDYDDFYEGMYKEIISRSDFDKEKRKKVKNIFLPYVYGASESLISEKCNLKIETTKEICKRIKETFSKTFDWLEDYTNSADSMGFYKNKFGKKRKIEQRYKAINFIVQSTSSIFCLDKLIDIYNALNGENINFYIHDGYVFSINKKELDSKIKIIKNIMLEQSDNFKDIILNVSCLYGRNLNDLVDFKAQEVK